ncbi:hypothetical protein HK405_008883, partial [Cladochytrium tenue]
HALIGFTSQFLAGNIRNRRYKTEAAAFCEEVKSIARATVDDDDDGDGGGGGSDDDGGLGDVVDGDGDGASSLVGLSSTLPTSAMATAASGAVTATGAAVRGGLGLLPTAATIRVAHQPADLSLLGGPMVSATLAKTSDDGYRRRLQ